MILYYIKWLDLNSAMDGVDGDINKCEFFRKEADAIQRMWDIKKLADESGGKMSDTCPPDKIHSIEFSGINQLVEALNKINFVIK